MKTKREKMVSIIVPVYNVEKYLSQCLDSIREQTYKEWECIVIDDGSSDKSWEICRYYAVLDKRFITVHQINLGVSKARNVGIDMAKGEWIAFVDADDWLDNDYIEYLLEMQKRYNPEWFFCEFVNHFPNGKRKKSCFNSFSVELHNRNTLIQKTLANGKKRACCSPYCSLYNANLLKKNSIRFHEEFLIGEDRVFNMEYAQYINHFYYSKEVKYNRRCRKGSATNRCRENVCKEVTAVLKYLINVAEKYGIEEKTIFEVIVIGISQILNMDIMRTDEPYKIRKKRFYKVFDDIDIKPYWDKISLNTDASLKRKFALLCAKLRMLRIYEFCYRIKHYKEDRHGKQT